MRSNSPHGIDATFTNYFGHALVFTQSGGEKVSEPVTARRHKVAGVGERSRDHHDEAPVTRRRPPRRGVVNSPPPPRHLVTKLLEQNSRLKNVVRQLIAERGLTVAQYLVGYVHDVLYSGVNEHFSYSDQNNDHDICLKPVRNKYGFIRSTIGHTRVFNERQRKKELNGDKISVTGW